MLHPSSASKIQQVVFNIRPFQFMLFFKSSILKNSNFEKGLCTFDMEKIHLKEKNHGP